MPATEEATAADMMTSPVRSVTVADSIQDVAAIFTDDAISAAVVTDERGRPVGVITKTDIVRYQSDRTDACCDGKNKDVDLVQRWMSAAIFWVERKATRKLIAREMVKYGTHHVFVKSEFSDAVVGVVSSFDVLRDLAFGEEAADGDRS